MNRHSYPAAFLLFVTLLGPLERRLAGASVAVQQAAAALQHQDFKGAEEKLRAELKLHPNDAEALSLLGVALDIQKRFSEAVPFHRKAVANAPRSIGVLDNYANNLLATGDEKGAGEVLLKALAVDPADRTANMGMAQISLGRKDGAAALIYLERLQDVPETAIQRLIALDLAGERVKAQALFDQLSAATRNDGKASVNHGLALMKAGQFEQAATFLTQALATNPANFQILYNLGISASQAGHKERAIEVLEAARRQQPQNVDALFALAYTYSELTQPEPAIRLLVEAARLAPQRPDIQKLLAITAGDIKAHDDAVAAWERYLKLVPGDDTARRDLAFEKARLALFDEALPGLQAYVAKHPDDVIGLYELGVTEGADDPEKAIARLNRAIALQPDFLAARAARGELLYGQNKREAALPDLEFAAKHSAEQTGELASVLDRLGQTYAALNRLTDAVPVLRKAVELAPDDPKTLLHLANALAEAGKTEESETLMARFRTMHPGERARTVSGVVDYLSMTAEQRHDLYRTRLEKTIHDHPEDSAAQLLYLKFLLTDNQMPEANADAVRFAALKPSAGALADAGHALLEARQYSTAKQLLDQAAAADTSVNVKLDLAIAVFHSAGSGSAAAGEGLAQLERVPEAARNAGYYLARAQMLNAAGQHENAIAAMTLALRAAPEDPTLYWQAAVLMAQNHREDDALQLLDQAAKVLPQEAQIPVIRAVVLEIADKAEDALRLLGDAQRRWPEVPAVWVAHGIILGSRRQYDEARKSLETAVALGARSVETRLALSAITSRATTGPGSAVDPLKLFLSGPPRDW